MDEDRESQLNLKKHITRENAIILNNINRKEEKRRGLQKTGQQKRVRLFGSSSCHAFFSRVAGKLTKQQIKNK